MQKNGPQNEFCCSTCGHLALSEINFLSMQNIYILAKSGGRNGEMERISAY